jgi:hypothetical protein
MRSRASGVARLESPFAGPLARQYVRPWRNSPKRLFPKGVRAETFMKHAQKVFLVELERAPPENQMEL